MRSAVILVSAALAAATTAVPTQAQEGCFCLQHPAGGVARYGCTASRIPNRSSERIVCLNPERTDDVDIREDQDFELLKDFPRVLGGEGICNPCRPEPEPDPERRPDTVRQPGTETVEEAPEPPESDAEE